MLSPVKLNLDWFDIVVDDFVPMKGVIPYDIIDCNKGKIYFAWESDDRGSIKVVDFASRVSL